jgi:hypothetical protein
MGEHRRTGYRERSAPTRRVGPALVTAFMLAVPPVMVVLMLLLFPASPNSGPAGNNRPVIQVVPPPRTSAPAIPQVTEAGSSTPTVTTRS